jgi:hypothetical protein
MAELYPLLPAAQDVLGELAEALERRASAGEPACVAPVRAGAGGRASPVRGVPCYETRRHSQTPRRQVASGAPERPAASPASLSSTRGGP